MRRKDLPSYYKQLKQKKKNTASYGNCSDAWENDKYTSVMSEDENIRVRMLKINKGKSKAKTIERFSVGYEIEVSGKIYNYIRYCNFHDTDKRAFHMHKLIKIQPRNKYKRTPLMNRKKIPSSQMTWALNNIKKNHSIYRREFFSNFF
jgi:hypothetical protein